MPMSAVAGRSRRPWRSPAAATRSTVCGRCARRTGSPPTPSLASAVSGPWPHWGSERTRSEDLAKPQQVSKAGFDLEPAAGPGLGHPELVVGERHQIVAVHGESYLSA